MQLTVHHAGKAVEVSLEDTADSQLHNLNAAIEAALDVPVHRQKLICKGKVLGPGKPLSSFGVKHRAKIMLLASGADARVRYELSLLCH